MGRNSSMGRALGPRSSLQILIMLSAPREYELLTLFLTPTVPQNHRLGSFAKKDAQVPE